MGATDQLRGALARAMAQGRTDLYYEEVYNDLLDRLEMRAVPVPPDDWMEVDDLADLARARARFAGDG